MKKVVVIILSLLLLSSCDIFMEDPQDDGKLYLIAIGLGYQQNSRINKLDNTYNDFRGIIEQFETLAEFSGRDYEITTYSDYASKNREIIFGFDHRTSDQLDSPIFHPYTERMREPEIAILDTSSRENIRKSFIEELTKVFESTSRPQENDLIFFYFTGHGTEKGGPVIHHSEEKDILFTDLDLKRIEKELLSRYSSRAIMIIDCCYSGRAIDDSELGSSLKFEESTDKDGNSDYKLQGSLNIGSGFTEGFSRSNPLPGIMYLTAATDRQMSYDYDMYQNGWNSDKYGAFTYQILNCWGYDTENMRATFPLSRKGSRITLGETYSYIKENMSRENRSKSTPMITRSRYDITLFDFSR